MREGGSSRWNLQDSWTLESDNRPWDNRGELGVGHEGQRMLGRESNNAAKQVITPGKARHV